MAHKYRWEALADKGWWREAVSMYMLEVGEADRLKASYNVGNYMFARNIKPC